MRAYAMLLAWVAVVGCEADPAPAGPVAAQAPADLSWRDVASAGELSTLAAEAHAANKALLLDVRADWCAPCKQLEAETFSDPAVKAVLKERFVLARLDATDPAPPAESLQNRVGAQSMPKLLLWTMDAADAEVFGSGKLPPAAKTISTFVAAEEFLPVVQTY